MTTRRALLLAATAVAVTGCGSDSPGSPPSPSSSRSSAPPLDPGRGDYPWVPQPAATSGLACVVMAELLLGRTPEAYRVEDQGAAAVAAAAARIGAPDDGAFTIPDLVRLLQVDGFTTQLAMGVQPGLEQALAGHLAIVSGSAHRTDWPHGEPAPTPGPTDPQMQDSARDHLVIARADDSGCVVLDPLAAPGHGIQHLTPRELLEFGGRGSLSLVVD